MCDSKFLTDPAYNTPDLLPAGLDAADWELHPTVSLTFKTDRARNAFLYYLKRIGDGAVVNPTLAVVFDNLSAPVSVTETWQRKADDE